MSRPDLHAVELVAVLFALRDDEPVVLTLGAPDGVPALPSGPLQADHRSLQAGLRGWVEMQTGHDLGYLEQLYTFADRERGMGAPDRVVSVSYLGLTRAGEGEGGWRRWYELFPWEDRRAAPIPTPSADAVRAWVEAGASAEVVRTRQARVNRAFGGDGGPWRAEDCLSRYELLWEAGLVPEAGQRGADSLTAPRMLGDHRRILATGMARLRAKLQYRPVVFELMPDTFTLGDLQRTVEALAGTRVRTQNFRRLVEQQDLVEETGELSSATGGRPAKIYRFRRDALLEHDAPGTRLPVPRPPSARGLP